MTDVNATLDERPADVEEEPLEKEEEPADILRERMEWHPRRTQDMDEWFTRTQRHRRSRSLRRGRPGRAR